MAFRLSERDRILLGYPPQPNPAPAASDLDFADVFGGPPRSSSLSDSLRQSLGDCLDSGSSRIGERPIFGEISSPSRRRHLKDDFFSDIFQSGESACSSPRRGERDFFNSPSPGSRVLSPTRPLPPARAEVAAGGYSQPAQLSFSLKSTKGIDHPRSSPTPRSQGKDEDGSPDMLPSPAAAFTSSFPARAVMAQDDMIVDGSASYHRSPLSRQVSHNLEKSSAFMDSTVLRINSHSKTVPTTSLEDYVNKGQFHFSIYKWAGKGVTLVMPSKSNLSHQGRLKRLPEVVVQAVDMILQEDNMSNLTTANRSEREDADELLKDVVIESKNDMYSTAAEATMTAGFGTEFLHSDKTEKSVNEEIARQVEGTDDLPKSQQSVQGNIKAKEQTGKKNKRSTVKVTTPTMRDPVSPEEKMRGSRVKEKVKDFIRIFNQEGSPKRKGTSETSCRGSKGNDNAEGKEHDQDKVSGAKASEPVKSTSKRDNSTLSEPFIPINQNVKMAEEVNFIASFDGEMTDETSFERKDTLTQCSDPTPDVFDTSVCNAEEDSHYEDLEGVLVEPLSHNQNEDLPTSSHQDQIKSIDGKIREWSKGKEGNIRSLISTLQFVLWPESGWKPVRLVDIIEGSSVKRAYQKALLCLHPDKLQQKGASAVQKYLAEKVFDIMQEAWEQFNTITQITWT